MGVTNRRKAHDGGDVEASPSSEPSGPHYRSNSQPFAGRLGANQAYVVEGGTSEDDHLLHHAPDATPHMSFWELMDMRPIKNLDLWKAALIEGIGNFTCQPQDFSINRRQALCCLFISQYGSIFHQT
jgi:hypothetical protein